MAELERPTIILLGGVPGSGTSTLGQNIAEHPLYADTALHISLGDEVRRVGRGDWMMDGAHAIEQHLHSPDRHELLSDELAYDVTVEALRRHRWRKQNASLYLLDGIPRRTSQISDVQTIAATIGARIGGMIYTDVDDETSIARQLKRGRRSPDDEAPTEEEAARRVAIHHETVPAVLLALQHQHILVERIDTRDGVSTKKQTTDRALGAVGMMLLHKHTDWDYDESPA